MTMLAIRREDSWMPWLTVTGAFALGAASTWLGVWVADRLRPPPAPIGDDVVLERVRERIAQVASRPEAIDVSVENGVVRLAGDIAPEERDSLLAQLLYMPGVRRLRNALGTASS